MEQTNAARNFVTKTVNLIITSKMIALQFDDRTQAQTTMLPAAAALLLGSSFCFSIRCELLQQFATAVAHLSRIAKRLIIRYPKISD